VDATHQPTWDLDDGRVQFTRQLGAAGLLLRHVIRGQIPIYMEMKYLHITIAFHALFPWKFFSQTRFVFFVFDFQTVKMSNAYRKSNDLSPAILIAESFNNR
jgi:hypothetical protein